MVVEKKESDIKAACDAMSLLSIGGDGVDSDGDDNKYFDPDDSDSGLK